MSEYWCAECDEWNVNCSCKASKIIKELEEKLAVAQKSLVDYETDWVKMRKYYDGAMVKMAIAIEALEKADKTLSLTYYSFQPVRQDINEALEKIKR